MMTWLGRVMIAGGCVCALSCPAKDRTTVQSILDGMVRIPDRDFWLSETELTQGQWEVVMGYNPSGHKGPNLPVECVSKNDADIFIDRLNECPEIKASKFEFGLPTPGEWQYAAGAGGSNRIEDRAWIKENSDGVPHDVATKTPNAFGIYDIQGNVWEWMDGPKSAKGERRGGSYGESAGGCSIRRWIHTPRGRRYDSCGLRVSAYLRGSRKTNSDSVSDEKSKGGGSEHRIRIGKDANGKEQYMVRYSNSKSEDTAVEVYNAVKHALVIIEGKTGCGSGFVAEADGKKWLYSNEHVARIGHPLKATFINGKEIDFTGAFQVAVNRDLVRMEIKDNVSALKIREDAPSIEELVFVYGNSAGGGVITKIIGKVLGVGDDKIETNAKFVGGNSGSPMLDSKCRVVGVATEATFYRDPQDWIKSDTRYNNIRRYGMRLANVQWENVAWDVYAFAARQLADLDAFKDFFLPVCFRTKTIVTEYKAKEMAAFKSIRPLSAALSFIEKNDKQYLKALADFDALVKKRERTQRGSMQYPTGERMKMTYGKLHRALLESLYARKKALKVASQFPAANIWPCQRMKDDARGFANGFAYWHDAYKEDNDETLKEMKWHHD